MKYFFVFWFAIVVFVSCKTVKFVPVESVKREFIDRIIYDSVFFRDSIFIEKKSDTLIMEKYCYLYKYKIIRDSIFRGDTVRVPFPIEVSKEVKKSISGWQNVQIWMGRILFVLLLGFFLKNKIKSIR
jgi:hypothetical protein